MTEILKVVNPLLYKEIEKVINYGAYGKKGKVHDIKCNIQDIENYIAYLLFQKAEAWQKTVYQPNCRLAPPPKIQIPYYDIVPPKTLVTDCGYIRVNLRDFITSNDFIVDWRRSFLLEGAIQASYVKVGRNGYLEYKTEDRILVDYVHIAVFSITGEYKQIRFFIKTNDCQTSDCPLNGFIEEVNCLLNGFISEITCPLSGTIQEI